MFTPLQISVSFAFGLFFAFAGASPHRQISPYDERLSKENRWGYFTFSLLCGFIACLITSYTWINASGLITFFVILTSIITLTLSQATYYLYLAKAGEGLISPEDNK